MQISVLNKLLEVRSAKISSVLATRLPSGEQSLFTESDSADFAFPEILADARDAIWSDRSKTVATESGEVFLQVFNPPLRLFVVGAVHITQSLVSMASALGYAVSVIDPRHAFATESRFPGVSLSSDWPDEVLEAQALDARSAVVTLTHDPKIDDPALHAALASPAFYIGCLGSKRTHAARLERLREAGVSAQDLERLHGPIGVAIGARSPEEIAISILAQMTSVLRAGAVR